MKEKEFISRNVEKWREVESLLNDKDVSTYKLYDVLQNNADDVSVARTFFKTRNISRFTNQLTVRLQQKFGFVSSLRVSLTDFYTEKLPYTIYQTRWNFLWAVVFFIFAFLIGYYSSQLDEKFAASVLGDSYVRMTEENIKSGDPMKVYKESGRIDMTFGIMFNNIEVCLSYFLVGILAGVGSIALMMFEGVRVGAFLNFFARHHLLAEANLTIWMHGILEISAIVIGTAAGITLGTGYIFPKTLSRAASFKKSARYAMNIFLGLLPMLVFAAIIEGNITRHTGIGQTLRGIFILLNLLLIILYFGWYPFYKNRKGFNKNLDIKISDENFNSNIDLKVIYNFEDTFKHIFIWFGKFNTVFVRQIIFSSLLVIAFIIYVAGTSTYEKFGMQLTSLNSFEILKTMFHAESVPLLSFCYALVFALVSYFVGKSFERAIQEKIVYNPMDKKNSKNSTTVGDGQFIINFIFSIGLYFSVVKFLAAGYSLIFILSIMFVANVVQNGYCLCISNAQKSKSNSLGTYLLNYFYDAVLIFGDTIKNRSGRFQLYLFFLLLTFLAFLTSVTSISGEYFRIISWNLSFLNETQSEMVSTYILLGFNLCIFFALFILMNISGALTAFNDLEAKEGSGIIERINAIKPLRSTMGIIREN